MIFTPDDPPQRILPRGEAGRRGAGWLHHVQPSADPQGEAKQPSPAALPVLMCPGTHVSVGEAHRVATASRSQAGPGPGSSLPAWGVSPTCWSSPDRSASARSNTQSAWLWAPLHRQDTPLCIDLLPKMCGLRTVQPICGPSKRCLSRKGARFGGSQGSLAPGGAGEGAGVPGGCGGNPARPLGDSQAKGTPKRAFSLDRSVK